MKFRGFDPEAVRLLERLPALDAVGFGAIKARLTSGIVEPAASFIDEVAASLDAGLTVVRRSSVSPLHADLRFVKPGAARYKDHLLLTAWHGVDKKVGPTLWVRLGSRSVGFASGVALAGAQREQFRSAVASARGTLLEEALQTIRHQHKKHDVQVAGDQLKKVPPPWPCDHERADLLRMTSFQVRFREPAPRTVAQATFVDWCANRLRDLIPVHRWLVGELVRRGRR